MGQACSLNVSCSECTQLLGNYPRKMALFFMNYKHTFHYSEAVHRDLYESAASCCKVFTCCADRAGGAPVGSDDRSISHWYELYGQHRSEGTNHYTRHTAGRIAWYPQICVWGGQKSPAGQWYVVSMSMFQLTGKSCPEHRLMVSDSSSKSNCSNSWSLCA